MSEAADDGFVFSTSLTVEDHAQFFDLIARRQDQRIGIPPYVTVAFIGALPVAIGAALWAQSAMRRADGWGIGLLCGAAYLVGLYAMAIASRASRATFMRRLTATAAVERPRMTVTVDAHGVKTASDETIFAWRWSAVERVTVENGALVFWVGTSSAVRIPERAFANSAERDAVLAYALKQGISAARG